MRVKECPIPGHCAGIQLKFVSGKMCRIEIQQRKDYQRARKTDRVINIAKSEGKNSGYTPRLL